MPDGTVAHVCLGATMDEQLVRFLFGACIDASRVLGVDEGLRRELTASRAQLAPTRISADGRVMEWLEERPEADPHHRHVAHLWGLYPGTEISPRATPALAAAARRTLEVRGDASTGWSLAMKACYWARLGDGDRALRLLRLLLRPAGPAASTSQWGGGAFANLFNAGPVFQIDGNFGGTAAIAEMLLQSRMADDGTPEVRLLPALPAAWPDGSVRGLRARGAVSVDFTWRNGRLESAAVHNLAQRPGTVRVSLGDATGQFDLPSGGSVRLDGGLRRP